jgi:hypothetical protein
VEFSEDRSEGEMSEEKPQSLSRVFWNGYRDHHPDGTIVDLDAMPEEDQAAIEGGAHAVAARVANPDAADYDAAAEVMQLRSALVDAMLRWSGVDAFDQCASELAQILDQVPRTSGSAPQPAPSRAELETAMALALQDLIDEDAAQQPQPAPELQAGEIVYLYHWRFDRGEEFGLYRHAADANAAAAQHADEGLSEVLSIAVLGRPEQPAPELAAAMGEARQLRELVVDMLTAFTVTGSGHSARVGQVQIARWRKRAGLEG